MSIGDNIRRLRLEDNLTQEQLAEKLGVQRSAIGNWETGLRDPDLDTILRLSEFFTVSCDFLIGYEAAPEPQPAPAEDDSFGKRLRALRKKRGLTMEELAANLAEDFAKEMIDVTPTLMDACNIAIKARDILIGLFWERSKDNGQG